MIRQNPIGLFDSGVGGVSIWMAVQQLMPYENTVYLADNKNTPYGLKSKEEIIALSEKNTEFLLNNNAKIIVVACNTASTNAIPHLRQKYKVPFIRIQPAIKPAGLQSKTKKIGLLATEGTLKSEMLQELKQIIPTQDIQIIGQSGKGLVELVENQQINTIQTESLLKKYLKPMLDKNIDQLVLGCTHYPFLIPLIKKIVGRKVQIIEPSQAIARQTQRILVSMDMENSSNNNPVYHFYANATVSALQNILTTYPHVSIEKRDF